MDPTATLIRLLTALRDNDIDTACEALEDVAHWINRGGFIPNRLDLAIDALQHGERQWQ